MRKISLALALAAGLIGSAQADFTSKNQAGVTITFKSSGDCTSIVCVVPHYLTDSTGAAVGTAANPLSFQFGTGVLLPAFAATPTFNLGTLNGAATAAAQATGNTSVGNIDTSIGAQGNTTWDGSSAATLMAINRYQGVKLEAIRALVAGTLTVGLPSGAATAANQTGGGQKTQVVDASGNTIGAGFAAYATASITRPANTTTYTVNTGWNNATSGATNFFSLTGVCRVNGGQVLITRVDVWSSANPTLKLSGVLWLFSAVPGTNVNDNAAFNIASADFANLTAGFNGIGFTLGSNQSSGSNSGTSLSGTSYQAQCASGATTITGMVEVTNAYVPVSGEVLRVGIATVGLN
ncbi:hypothetical protein HAP47_0022655 [Bradyrhizobium sp. 41S5]|uniref:hypothetical protein n=1 Tax=Bradyrhizobium sp. 41S5 TaxID=1404443 RepID=UPI00156B5DF2|nr:hypothetical protein [Bradyrhizobium sp. 41S5]UFX42064.1 hypothetical protein HAP47_0022655 [Bradyrhizobium sp. 41S5]